MTVTPGERPANRLARLAECRRLPKPGGTFMRERGRRTQYRGARPSIIFISEIQYLRLEAELLSVSAGAGKAARLIHFHRYKRSAGVGRIVRAVWS